MVTVAIFLFSTVLFIFLAHQVLVEKKDWFDTRVFIFLKTHSSPLFIQVCKRMTFFGSSHFLLSAYVVLILFLLLRKMKKEAIAVAVAGTLAYSLLYGLKTIFKRARPDMPLFDTLTNYSFPSGHAYSSFIFFSVLALLIWKTMWLKKWKVILSVIMLCFTLAIGFSRIVLRYHYSSDVLAGFCLGCICLSAYLILRAKRIHYERRMDRASILPTEQNKP